MMGPDELQPYTCRATFTAETEMPDPAGMVSSLLEDIARRCEEAGCSLVGHIKCHARAGASHFHCNLTSSRSGAHCGRPGGEGVTAPGHLSSGDALELDLAVLVYGLSSSTLEALVLEAMAGGGPGDGESPFPGRWALLPSGCAGSSEPGAGHHCHR